MSLLLCRSQITPPWQRLYPGYFGFSFIQWKEIEMSAIFIYVTGFSRFCQLLTGSGKLEGDRLGVLIRPRHPLAPLPLAETSHHGTKDFSDFLLRHTNKTIIKQTNKKGSRNSSDDEHDKTNTKPSKMVFGFVRTFYWWI